MFVYLSFHSCLLPFLAHLITPCFWLFFSASKHSFWLVWNCDLRLPPTCKSCFWCFRISPRWWKTWAAIRGQNLAHLHWTLCVCVCVEGITTQETATTNSSLKKDSTSVAPETNQSFIYIYITLRQVVEGLYGNWKTKSWKIYRRCFLLTFQSLSLFSITFCKYSTTPWPQFGYSSRHIFKIFSLCHHVQTK